MKCPVCETENSASARFCQSCGTELAAPSVARREERKVVTVVFADLVGFTARAESLDPEDVERLLGPYHARLRSELQRHGGTVEKFIGDAVMAVFGAPVAHEDDAERAVRAALAIREWAQDQGGLELRLAVNTGEALVSLGARPEHGEALLKGDVVNTAARLQAAAPINGILVGETTFRATRHVIDFRGPVLVEAKGKTDPVPSWEAVAARSRFGVDVRHTGGAELVGRGRELEQLLAALARVRDERAAQLVTLVGVPGIGKSRLVWELFQRVDAQPGLTTWRQGRSLPYGEGISFWALGEMIKGEAGILESDPPEVAAQKLGHAVAAVLGESGQGEWVESHLRPLVGLGRERELRREQQSEAFAAWRAFIEGLGQRRPTVLVFEDLHWADDGMLDFIDHLADWAGGSPLLIVGTARPELLARRPGWGGGKANALTLTLSPLSEDETTALVHQLLGRPVLSAERQRALLERSGGNPLYAEEFVRLAEEGRGETLPETVQAIIAARLDALPHEHKALLQKAAVLGKIFWIGGLAALAGETRWAVEDALHALERREFVRREPRSSVASETEYAFRHALVREVAYDQLPRAQRAETHRRAAEWIESLGRPDDTAEMLAHHYVSALEYARAAGAPVMAFTEPARTALIAAGERALRLNAYAAAQRFFTAALDLTSDDHDARPMLLFLQASTLHATGDPAAIPALQEASAHLQVAGDGERAAVAEVMLAEAWWRAGQRARTDEHLARAQELVAEAPRNEARARVLSELSRYMMLAAKNEEAIELGTEALALARELGMAEVEAHALDNIGVARASLGDDRGIEDLERSIEIALDINSPEAARGYNNLAAVVALAGDLKRARELRANAVDVDKRLGRHGMARFAEGALLQHAWDAGEWADFMAASERYFAESDQFGRNYQDVYIWVRRSAVLLARDDADGALEAARISIERGREAADPQVLVPALSQTVRVEHELEMADAASRHADELLRFVEAGTAQPIEVAELALLADHLSVRGRLRATVDQTRHASRWLVVARLALAGDFAAAADELDAIGSPPRAALARLRAAEDLVARGRRSEADAELAKALSFWRRAGATRYIRRAESLLTASA